MSLGLSVQRDRDRWVVLADGLKVKVSIWAVLLPGGIKTQGNEGY